MIFKSLPFYEANYQNELYMKLINSIVEKNNNY